MNTTIDSGISVYLQTNWEQDEWDRIYFKVLRNSSFVYTFWEKESQQDQYPECINQIENTIVRNPIKLKVSYTQETDPIPSETTVSDQNQAANTPQGIKNLSGVRERRFERSNTQGQSIRGDSNGKIRTLDEGSINLRRQRSVSLTKKDSQLKEVLWYTMKIILKSGKEEELKCQSNAPLKQIQNQINDAKQQLTNLGLPLTIEPHERHSESYLSNSTDQEISYRGMVNLLLLILLTYHIRMILTSIEENGFNLTKEVTDFRDSGIMSDPKSYKSLFAAIFAIVFTISGYSIEFLVTKVPLNDYLVIAMIVTNLISLWAYPVVMIQYLQSNPLSGLYLMLLTVTWSLKLISFHHTVWDNRKMMRRIKYRIPASEGDVKDLEWLAIYLNVSQETLKSALDYPNNLTLNHYFRFMIAPTCCYQLQYPTTDRIRLSFVFKRIAEIVFCNLSIIYLVVQHMVPAAAAGSLAIEKNDYFHLFIETLKMSVPASYLWLLVFYMFFHSWMNLWAELSYFGDRRFYADWWNADNLGEYWRKWNHPIHNFLLRHVYYPMRRKRFSAQFTMLVTFTVSAIFHEFIVVGIFSVVNFIAFFIMMVNVPAMLIQKKLKKHLSGGFNNTLFWLCYVVLGQPLGIIVIYYQMINKNQQINLQISDETFQQFKTILVEKVNNITLQTGFTLP